MCCRLPRHRGQRPEQEKPGPQTQLVLSQPLRGNPTCAEGVSSPWAWPSQVESASRDPAGRRCSRGSGPGPLRSGRGCGRAPVPVTFQVTRRQQGDLRLPSPVHSCPEKLDNAARSRVDPRPMRSASALRLSLTLLQTGRSCQKVGGPGPSPQQKVPPGWATEGIVKPDGGVLFFLLLWMLPVWNEFDRGRCWGWG